MSKQIVVTVQPDGSTDIDLLNFRGEGCDAVMKDFTDGEALSVNRKKREHGEPDREAARERSRQ
jgi:hypothetical protein